ncbi:MAG: glycoside hydrolase family 13 protein [Segniliparus sp.]|uniref:glycoside hydrolase family 13 protein n=1 Tax=Segniliparus sp. TaxID=2804064 RepID=UPI003F3CC759
MTQSEQWWDDAVLYQVYPRSFKDANGDGVGDLDGVAEGLDHLVGLGIDGLWLSPIMRSPMADHGYDVSDPRDVDPLFGGLEAFDRLLAAAHARGLKLIMDLVPNHTSEQHPWFQAALAAAPGSPERERYIFRDGKGENGDEPPNNWPSIFGGPAWTRVHGPDGAGSPSAAETKPEQWYLHIFAPEQPDLNWENPEVLADLETTLRFWLDRGADGFRIDVAHGMAKPPGLPDMTDVGAGLLDHSPGDLRFNHPDVHDIHRRVRAVLDEYPGRMTVGEIWARDDETFAAYLRPDELHLGFNFKLVEAEFEAEELREAITRSFEAVRSVAGTATWTLSNHDVEREATRYGGGEAGLARARAMALVVLALPGVVFVYNGAELGLESVQLPDEALQDPMWERSGHTLRGRDSCRVPLPWSGDEPPYGFSAAASTWLPMPEGWGDSTVAHESADGASTLSLYREAIALRRSRPEFSEAEFEWLDVPEGQLAFRRGGLVCALNTTDAPVAPPWAAGGEIASDGVRTLLASAPLEGGLLPPNTAVWVATNAGS